MMIPRFVVLLTNEIPKYTATDIQPAIDIERPSEITGPSWVKALRYNKYPCRTTARVASR